MQELLPLGVITRPHGIKGELRIHLFNQESSALMKASSLFLRASDRSPLKEFSVTKVRQDNKGFVIKLKECDDRNRSEELRKYEVLISHEELPELSDEEFYYHQIKGLQVFATEGELLGKALQILPNPGHDLLLIEIDGKEHMIPFVDEFVKKIDPEKDRIEIHLLEGMLEIQNT